MLPYLYEILPVEPMSKYILILYPVILCLVSILFAFFIYVAFSFKKVSERYCLGVSTIVPGITLIIHLIATLNNLYGTFVQDDIVTKNENMTLLIATGILGIAAVVIGLFIHDKLYHKLYKNF